MKLETAVLDKALEWLIPRIGTKKTMIINDEGGEIDLISALCVWCLRLRFNLVEHNRDGIDSMDYPGWFGYQQAVSHSLYRTVKEMAKLFVQAGGRVPNYGSRDHRDISKWTYKRIFGPDIFQPIHFNVIELWQAVQEEFGDITSKLQDEEMETADEDFIAFEINNTILRNIIKEW